MTGEKLPQATTHNGVFVGSFKVRRKRSVGNVYGVGSFDVIVSIRGCDEVEDSGVCVEESIAVVVVGEVDVVDKGSDGIGRRCDVILKGSTLRGVSVRNRRLIGNEICVLNRGDGWDVEEFYGGAVRCFEGDVNFWDEL